MRVHAAELAAHVGERVTVAGWLHHQRQLASVSFLLVRDVSGISQVVVDADDAREIAASVAPESALSITGTVVATEQVTAGAELHDPVIEVLGPAVALPPFEMRRPQVDLPLPTQLDHAAVSLRHPSIRAALAIAAASMSGFRRALDARGFTEIQTPKVVGAATESGANVFSLDWFGRPAFLAQSPQLYKQMMVGVFERVYEVGPVFRAEPHDTVRHLAEYVSLDVELGFIDDHRDVEAVLRDVLEGMVSEVAERAHRSVEVLGIDLPAVPEEIPRIHFTDAQQLLERALGEQIVGEPDLAPAHERWLGEWARAEHGSEFLFVEGYPMVKRPFYTHPDPERPASSNSFDLLFRGMELVTGGQRLHRYDDYVAAMDAETAATLTGYLDAFRYGMPPHGGFAIGLERWTARIVGAANVRQVTAFPRDLHRLAP